MKRILPIILLLTFHLSFGQKKPVIDYVSKSKVIGFSIPNSTVYASSAGVQMTPVKVPGNGKFELLLTPNLNVGDKVVIWAKYDAAFFKKDYESEKETYSVLSDDVILNLMTDNLLGKETPLKINKLTENNNDLIAEIAEINSLNDEKQALKNTVLVYKTTIWSTNFNIPLVRFNFVKNDATKQGDILLFNSIGAGFGYYAGRLERTRDSEGEIVNEDFSASWGVSVGALFSGGTGEESKNVFAPVINGTFLDFQIGVGIELGTRTPNQKREFVTLSYAIPLYKLFKRSYRIKKGYDVPIELIRKSQD